MVCCPRLVLDTNHDGQIFVTSKVSAAANAQILPPPPPKHHHRQPGPSRLRRRARRAQTREAASASAETAAATAEKGVQTDQSSLQTSEAAVQAVQPPTNPAPLQPHQVVPAAQASPADGQQRAAQAQNWPATSHRLPDAFCPDTVYQSAAAQVAPPHQSIPLDGHNQEAAPVLPCPSDIPQLDGNALDTRTHECENCHTKFTTEVQLKHHDEIFQYGCEDCNICYQSTYLFDLHELAEHPDSHYALSIIPHSTKLQFARSYK